VHDTSGPTTIHLPALINGVSIQVLDIFIQPHVAKLLQLLVEPAPNLCVMVGNFKSMIVEGCIKSLNVLIQGILVTRPEVYVLNVAGRDLVIGITWLKTLGAHIFYYNASFIYFKQKGKFVTSLQAQRGLFSIT